MTLVSYKHDIRGKSTDYHINSPASETDFFVPLHDRIALSDEEKRTLARVEDDLDHVYTTYLPEYKKRSPYAVVNDTDAATRNLLIGGFGWGSSLRQHSTRDQIGLIALQNPDTRLIIPATPGIYGDDRFPSQVMRTMQKTGSYLSAGAFMWEGVQGAVDDERPLDGSAYSESAREAIGMFAASRGIRVATLIDPPGSRARSTLGMMYDASYKEGQHHKEYQALERLDPETQMLEHERFLGSSLGRAGLRQTFESLGGMYDAIVRQSRALGRKALRNDLMFALPKITDELRIISPHNSELNRFDEMAELVGFIARSEQRPLVIKHIDLPDATHAYAHYYPYAHAHLLSK